VDAGPMLRVMLADARPLVPIDDLVAKGVRTHPLQAGLEADRRIRFPDLVLAWPREGAPFEQLRSDVGSAPAPPVEPEFADSAWAALLGATHQFEVTPVPAAPDPGEHMTAISSVRALGLLTPLSAPLYRSGRAPGDAADTRLVATGVLTVGLDRRDVVWARLQAGWAQTTSSLLAWLDGIGFRGPTSAERVSILVHPDESPQFRALDRNALDATASVLGLRLDVIDRGVKDRRYVERRVGQSAGVVLIPVGPDDESTRALRASHRSAVEGARCLPLAPDARPLLERLREQLITAAGLDAALRVLPDVPRRRPPSPRRPPLPVGDPADCLHHKRTSRVYVLDGSSGLWWTRDKDEHGGSVFKAYRLVADRLEHEADCDAAGDPIPDKHKGPIGRVMNRSEFRGCGRDPSKHLV